jgi:mRNA-degrading endonuclease YafQ of YafQ-DinJ toxin-antitoxin module
MPKSRLSAALSVFLVFFSGTVLGAFSYRLYSLPSVQSVKDTGGPPRKLSPVEWRKKYVSDLSTALKMDDQQVSQLNKILDRTREEFEQLNQKVQPAQDALNAKFRPEREAIQSQQVDAINALLRPEQKPLYDSFRAERERMRKLHMQQKKQ